MLLDEKVSIITGGARGIGLEIANRFLKEGSEIVIFDIIKEPKELSKNMHYYYVDVSNMEEVRSAVEKVINKFKNIDVLVNSAGIIERESFLDISEQSWDKHFDVDCKGTFICCQSVLNYMTRKKLGSIINISSIAGHIVRTQQAHYCAAKAAVIHLTRCLSVEFAPFNIRINSICPGMTYSGMLEDVFKKESIDKNKILQNIPLGKFAEAKDHAEIAVFLASDKSSHITGQIISVDGGQSLNLIY